MCKCTPNIRTPFCGKPGCEAPEKLTSNLGAIAKKLREHARGIYNTNAFRAGALDDLADEIESLSGGNPGEKSDGLQSDHRGLSQARSSDGGNGEQALDVSIQSREPVDSNTVPVGRASPEQIQAKDVDPAPSIRADEPLALRTEVQTALINAAQLIDGIKNTAPQEWTEWDQQVRDSISALIATKPTQADMARVVGSSAPPTARPQCGACLRGAPHDEPCVDVLRAAIGRAYGYLWHVNNEPGTPGQYPPERAAYEARKILRDLLTHEERGQCINDVRAALTKSVHTWQATATGGIPQTTDNGDTWEMGPTQGAGEKSGSTPEEMAQFDRYIAEVSERRIAEAAHETTAPLCPCKPHECLFPTSKQWRCRDQQ